MLKSQEKVTGEIISTFWIKFFLPHPIFFLQWWVYYFKHLTCFDTRCSQMCWAHVKIWANSLGWKELGCLIFWGILFAMGASAIISWANSWITTPELSKEIPFWHFQSSPSRTGSLWLTYFDHTGAHSTWPQKVYKSSVLGSECLPPSPWIRPYFLLAAWRYSENDRGGFVECSGERNKALILLIM